MIIFHIYEYMYLLKSINLRSRIKTINLNHKICNTTLVIIIMSIIKYVYIIFASIWMCRYVWELDYHTGVPNKCCCITTTLNKD